MSFQKMDIVKPIGNGWTSKVRNKCFVIEGYDCGDPFFRTRNGLYCYPQSTGPGECKVVGHVSDFVKVINIDAVNDALWWQVNGPRIVQEATSRVKSELKTTLRAWPLEEDLFHLVDRESKQIKFFFAHEDLAIFSMAES